MQLRSDFWIKWLKTISISIIIFGVLLSFTPFIEWTIGQFYYDIFFNKDQYSLLSKEELLFQRFIYGATGGLLACWGLMIYFITKYGLENNQYWAWKALISSTLAWFIGDSYASVLTGFEIHAMMNFTVLILILLPLYSIKKNMVMKTTTNNS